MTRALVLSLACLVGCAHATKTESVAKKGPDPKSAEPKKEAPEKAEPKKPAAARDEMSTSATTRAMFKPEGLEAMQKALVKKGSELDVTGLFDTQTQEALRAFQKAQTLPDTGLPDFETLRRLGLKPDEVYQPSTPAERIGVE